MKRLLLIIGIISIIACVLFLLFAFLNMFGYYNVVDGTAGLYKKMHQRMIISFTVGAVLAVIGTVCIIIQSKI